MMYLGAKATASLRIAEAAELHPDEMVERLSGAIERFREKPVLRKLEELHRRGYVTCQASSYPGHGYRLTPKGRQALRDHLGDAAHAPCLVSDAELRQMAAHCGSLYPEEGCGVVLADLSGVRHVRPVANVQAELHQINPRLFPKTAREAYAMAADEVEEIGRLLRQGWKLPVIFHSHVDSPPVFSADDAAKALLPGGQNRPLFPSTEYVVLGLGHSEDGGAGAIPVNAAAAYRFVPAAGGFLPVKLQVVVVEAREDLTAPLRQS